jgi:hypothetical protein
VKTHYLVAMLLAPAVAVGAVQCSSSSSTGDVQSLSWGTTPVLDASVYVAPEAGVVDAGPGGATGSPCTADSQCAGSMSVCRLTLYQPDGAPGTAIPGGECSSRCDPANNDPTSGVDPECPGGSGQCTKNVVLGNICYASCSAKSGFLPCRSEFSCNGGGTSTECVPTADFVCDPTVAGSCPVDDAGGLQSCESVGLDPVGDCVPGCDPLAPDCAASDAGPTGCYPTPSGDGLCQGGGTREAGAPCVYTNDCLAGLSCFTLNVADGGTSTNCETYCGGAHDAGCGPGQTCHDYTSTVPQSTLGFCSP